VLIQGLAQRELGLEIESTEKLDASLEVVRLSRQGFLVSGDGFADGAGQRVAAAVPLGAAPDGLVTAFQGGHFAGLHGSCHQKVEGGCG